MNRPDQANPAHHPLTVNDTEQVEIVVNASDSLPPDSPEVRARDRIRLQRSRMADADPSETQGPEGNR